MTALLATALARPVAATPPGPVDGPPVTRSEAVLIADRFARVHWTMTEAHRTGTACGGGFTSTYPPGERIGMAYKWGDWDTVEEFLDKLARGYGAGTGGGPDTYAAYPRDCVTGTSCAGLVSRAWRLDHKYTLDYADPAIRRKLGEITHPVAGFATARATAGDLRKGDALLSSTHVMLYLYETRDHRIRVIDARLPGAACRSVGWSWLHEQHYAAIRYNHIVDEGEPAGTLERPIVVGADGSAGRGPWEVAGNTRDVVSLAIDRYACARGSNQQGPEIVYAFHLMDSSDVRLEITDFPDEGIDNDVHLLTTLRVDETRSAPDALARGDRCIERSLAPGTYYVVVDSGRDRPGEFTLRITTE